MNNPTDFNWVAPAAVERDDPWENPYVGIRPFGERDALFGRTREAANLVDLLLAQRVVLLYSPSGAGKTSLLQSCVLREMRQRGFEVLRTIRVGLPIDHQTMNACGENRYIESAILSLASDENARGEASWGGLLHDLLTTSADKPHLLVFDQFEEILTQDPTDRGQKQQFFAELGAILANRNVWAVFAMREEFVTGLEPFTRQLPTRLSGRFRLDFLSLEGARLAIRKPAEAKGVTFTDQAVDDLVSNLAKVVLRGPNGGLEVRDGLFVEPVQLQLVCRRLWDSCVTAWRSHPHSDRVIGEEQIRGLGDVDQVFAEYYTDQVRTVAQLTAVSEARIRDWVATELISPARFRSLVPEEALARAQLLRPAIDALTQTPLIRWEQYGGRLWLELAHDRLVEPILQSNEQWLPKHASNLRRFAELWKSSNRDEKFLARGGILREITTWSSEHPEEVTPLEADFLKRSNEAAQERIRNRKTQNAIHGAVLALLLIVGFVVAYTTYQTNLAEARAAAREEGYDVMGLFVLDLLHELNVRSYGVVPGRSYNVPVDSLAKLDEFTYRIPEGSERLQSAEIPSQERLAQQRVDLLGNERVGSRQNTVVRYAPNDRTSAALAGELQQQGFRTLADSSLLIATTGTATARNSDYAPNAITFGDSVLIEDVRWIAYQFTRQGVPIKRIRLFPDSLRAKKHLEIELAHSPILDGWPQLTVPQIDSLRPVTDERSR